jgi:peptidoglycan/LPS O-acetylase OafA/YrhL
MGESVLDNIRPAKGHIKALTGLRIVAAMWVLMHHLSGEILTLLPGLSFLAPVMGRGGMGVDLFFILSGFILSYQYGDRLGSRFSWQESLRFIRLRVARVYPVHFVTLHMALLLSLRRRR